MQAIFEHNGFTRMDEVPDDPPKRYEIPALQSTNMFTTPDLHMSSNIKIWTFDLYGIEYVDGELVAIYKFGGEK